VYFILYVHCVSVVKKSLLYEEMHETESLKIMGILSYLAVGWF